eukprot:8131163-Heterocapsa_arctica.AAC.1
MFEQTINNLLNTARRPLNNYHKHSKPSNNRPKTVQKPLNTFKTCKQRPKTVQKPSNTCNKCSKPWAPVCAPVGRTDNS